MTVLFCDVKGFTSTSEGMPPRGLVKVMNRYFSTMSAPIRHHQGIIDKYIGDAIMLWQMRNRARLTDCPASRFKIKLLEFFRCGAELA